MSSRFDCVNALLIHLPALVVSKSKSKFQPQKVFKLFKPSVIPFTVQGIPPGTVLEANNKHGLQIATNNGILVIKEVQLEGKKRLPVADFIKGHPHLKEKVLGI